jgi:PTS system nitrogen regulatory IIA component
MRAPHQSTVDDLLTLRQLAHHLQISERTIYRLLVKGELPGFKVGGHWRFRRSVVDYWIDLRMDRMGSRDLISIEDDLVAAPLPLSDALRHENALISVPGTFLRQAIERLIEQVSFQEPVNRTEVLKRVWNREQLSGDGTTTAGVALLHTARWEHRALRQGDLFAIGRAVSPIVPDEVDHPVDLLLLLLARNAKQHLVLLTRAVRLCRSDGFLAGIREASSPGAVVTLVRNAEAQLFGPGSPS